MSTKSLITLNNNLMCAVDVETTGTDPNFHEIIQIAFLPLDQNLEPSKEHPPFDFKVRPRYIDRIDKKAMKVTNTQLHEILETGYEYNAAIDLFYHWFDNLGLVENKSVVPLGHNLTFDLPFIQSWLGVDAYSRLIFGHARDTQVIAAYLNDRAVFHGEQIPYPKLGLKAVASRLGIQVVETEMHDAVYDGWITAQVYKKLLVELFNV